MSDTEVFFPPYDASELRAILEPQVERAFAPGKLPDDVIEVGCTEAAQRWGDARKALRLFRRAGECANDRGQTTVTVDCLRDSLTETEREATVAKLRQLPLRHLVVLTVSVSWRDADGEIIQPVRTRRIHDALDHPEVQDRFQLGQRAIQQLVGELETMGLVTTWTESHGREGRAMYIETTFDPEWVRAAQAEAATEIGSMPLE